MLSPHELGLLPRLTAEHYAGDLIHEGRSDCPVEILFLDIWKTGELYDHAAELWFPRLIPDQSVVFPQDAG